MNDKLFDELIEGSIEMVGIEQLNRIASALERIAEALEKQNETNIMHVDDELISLRECGVLRRAGIDYCMMGDDKTAETCRAKFDGMPNFGKCPDDRYLTKEEAHALNRAVKRSTIKVHEGKLPNDD